MTGGAKGDALVLFLWVWALGVISGNELRDIRECRGLRRLTGEGARTHSLTLLLCSLYTKRRKLVG